MGISEFSLVLMLFWLGGAAFGLPLAGGGVRRDPLGRVKRATPSGRREVSGMVEAAWYKNAVAFYVGFSRPWDFLGSEKAMRCCLNPSCLPSVCLSVLALVRFRREALPWLQQFVFVVVMVRFF